MKIALVLNTRRDNGETQVEYDPPNTIALIKHGIEAAGHSYAFIEADENVVENLKIEKPDLVFNRSEGIRGESRESQVPAILEMLGIPYVGSGPLTLAVCLNKSWTKTFVAAAGVVTPQHHVVATSAEAAGCYPMFPVILKPNAEGSSIGINSDNVVFNREAFLDKVDRMLSDYGQALLVEEFVSGREFSVGVLGRKNGSFEVLPALEVDFSRMPNSVGNVFGQIAKTEYDSLDNYVCPAPIDDKLSEQLLQAGLDVCRILGIRDFARLDFRVNSEGNPSFLEINPLPGMDYDPSEKDFSFYTLMAFRAGYDYDQLIAQLIESARSRWGL